MNTTRFSMFRNRGAILLILAVALALIVAACDGDPTATNTQPANTPTTAPTETPTTAPTATTAAPTATTAPTATPEPVRQGTEEIRTSAGEVPFDPATEVWIYGSGFEPGQEVYLLLADSTGAQGDITTGGTTYPLVANEQGAWATKWTIDRWTRAAVAGQYSLTAVDTEFNVLATTPLALCPTELAAGEEQPNYCSPVPTVTPEPGTPIPGASPTP